MLTQILLTTVLLPLVLGVVIALAGRGGYSRSVLLTALLIPVAAAIASISIEGLPPFPPIAAKQKLPVLLVTGGVIFAILAALSRHHLNCWIIALVGVGSLAAPAWWLGRNVLAANATKAATLAIVLVIVAIELVAVSETRARKSSGAALPAALLATAIATALTAIMGGYIGMAQMNGALAALFGGWLLIGYIGYIRGDDSAFDLHGFAALSFIWTAAMGVTMTECDAAAIRQAKVKQYEAIAGGGKRAFRRVDRLHPIDGMIATCNMIAHRFPKRGIIFDQKNPQTVRSIPSRYYLIPTV
ncbi:hypothetical protein AXG93_303s1000 [Marchantia polymorpha subsp. ruderalis]|uniref:Uncharacterized protein n=1 Tax=Marchantia polymorpha subsp. ruderalis TaxID=1480154 RepID=A0A176WUH6_MARPO|nr:hypothetical protein AXG93_303s1000 [Marchantia polymorpha subsp. ruderalis]